MSSSKTAEQPSLGTQSGVAERESFEVDVVSYRELEQKSLTKLFISDFLTISRVQQVISPLELKEMEPDKFPTFMCHATSALLAKSKSNLVELVVAVSLIVLSLHGDPFCQINVLEKILKRVL